MTSGVLKLVNCNSCVSGRFVLFSFQVVPYSSIFRAIWFLFLKWLKSYSKLTSVVWLWTLVNPEMKKSFDFEQLQIPKWKSRSTLSTCKSRNEKVVRLWATPNPEMKKSFDFEHLQIAKWKSRTTLIKMQYFFPQSNGLESLGKLKFEK